MGHCCGQKGEGAALAPGIPLPHCYSTRVPRWHGDGHRSPGRRLGYATITADPLLRPRGPQLWGGGVRRAPTWDLAGKQAWWGGLSRSSRVPHQAMDLSGTPSVPLMIGCAVSCMALLTLLVIYAAFWR